jgi:hypothetical protein
VTTTDDDVRSAALSWLGVPFAHQGRSRELGVDCAGLILRVAQELGLLPAGLDVNGYRRYPDGTMRGYCDTMLEAESALHRAHLALIRFAIEPQHLALLVPRGDGWSLVHALERSGRVVQHRLDATWRSRIVQLYRYKGVVWHS